MDTVTDRDLQFVDFALKEGIDAFCVSFVEKADDIVKVRNFARERGRAVRVVAKIERAEAVRNIGEILDVADAIMIARGDLGVQIPVEDVPAVQKKLIRKANLLGRPVITATQMLLSMTENIRPTRAETSDVANAILDGTDAVMLSEETAIGRFPVETVDMMARIASSIEQERKGIHALSDLHEYYKALVGHQQMSVDDFISFSVVEAVRALDVRCIVAPTQSGGTPRRISRFKPDCWILALSRNEETHRFLNLSYGVFPVLLENNVPHSSDEIMKFISESELVKGDGEIIVAEDTAPDHIGGKDSRRVIRFSSVRDGARAE